MDPIATSVDSQVVEVTEAHRAGLDQGRAELERVSEVWAGQAT